VASVTNALGHTTLLQRLQRARTAPDDRRCERPRHQPRLRRAPAPGLSERGRRGDEAISTTAPARRTKVTLPDGSFPRLQLRRSTPAHRDVRQPRQSYRYTLDAMGNRTQEQVFDPTNTLAQTRSRSSNSLNRLAQELGAQSQTNAVRLRHPRQRHLGPRCPEPRHVQPVRRAQSPDQDHRPEPRADAVRLQRHRHPGERDRPRNLATTYNYDGLSNLNSQVSPTPAPPPAPTTPRGTCSPKPTPRAKRPPTPTTP